MIYTLGRRCKVISRKNNQMPVPDQPSVFQIRIKSHLGHQWTDWFDGMAIILEDDGNTLLSGPVVDQATLHGLIKKVRDLGMPLVSIDSVLPDRVDIG
jgi:hypothetical protein